MAYIEGEGRNQGTLFPVVLDDLVPADHMCRVVDAFVNQLDMEKLDFERAQPADTGRPGYNPRSHTEAVSLWLSKPDPLFEALRDRVSPQCGSDVAAGAAISRLQIDRGVPTHA